MIGFLPKTKLTLREATYLKKVFQLAEAVRDEGQRLKSRIDTNAERLDMVTVPDTRAYVGACRALREVLEIGSVQGEADRLEGEWTALVDRAVEEENDSWIFAAMS